MIFWILAFGWMMMADTDSGDLGIGFCVFLSLVYATFTFLAFRFPFVRGLRWHRYLVGVVSGLAVMVIWVLWGIGIAYIIRSH